jgi:hypothetical protein
MPGIAIPNLLSRRQLAAPQVFADSYRSFMHTIEEKGLAMERNPQQQKQGAVRSLSNFTFWIPDPSTHRLLFINTCPLTTVHGSL